MKLEVLLLTDHNVIKCSEYEYLIINDWSKLISSKISCPNQDNFLKNETLRIYNYSDMTIHCDAKNKKTIGTFYVSRLPQTQNKKQKLDKTNLPELSSTINIDDRNYSFNATMDNEYRALVHKISISWTSDMIHVLSMTFINQPLICRFTLYSKNQVKNGQCTNELATRYAICYYEPLSKLPVQNVDWTQLLDFLHNETYPPPDWRDKGGYYLDVRLLKTTITSITTTITTVTSTTITSTTSTTSTTTSTTTTGTSTTTTTATTGTSTTTTTTTSTTSTTTRTTVTTFDTSTSKSTSTMDSTWITTTPAETDTTAFITTSSTSSLIISSETDSLMSVTTDTTSTRRITSHKTRKTTTKLKPPKNNSAHLKKHPAKKNSSSPSILFLLLLIVFIFSIIGSILFFIFRFRRNRQNNGESLLDRHDSNESYQSDMDESEIEPSTDAKSELSETERSRKGGRMFTQLDPDAV